MADDTFLVFETYLKNKENSNKIYIKLLAFQYHLSTRGFMVTTRVYYIIILYPQIH